MIYGIKVIPTIIKYRAASYKPWWKWTSTRYHISARLNVRNKDINPQELIVFLSNTDYPATVNWLHYTTGPYFIDVLIIWSGVYPEVPSTWYKQAQTKLLIVPMISQKACCAAIKMIQSTDRQCRCVVIGVKILLVFVLYDIFLYLI